MTLGQQLYVILLLIYLSDCLWWIPHRGWFLQGAGPGKCRARFAGSLGNLQGGFVLLNLVPGWVFSFELREWPFSVSEKGWTAWMPQVLRPGGRGEQGTGVQLFGKSEQAGTRKGKELLFPESGGVDARGADVAEADLLFLQELNGLPEEKRVARIESVWKEQVDAEAVNARFAEVMSATRWLRFTGQMQWMAMVVVTPLWCRLWGLDMGILRSVALIFGLALVNTVLFCFAHRRLYPLSRSERWKHACVMMISLPMSARGADLLTRPALLGFQAPAVVAALAAPAGENRRLLQHWQRDLCYPIRIELEEGAAREVAESYIAWRLRTWKKWWQQLPEAAWREEEDLNEVPEGRRVCPRCLEDFTLETLECPDCPGVMLNEPTVGKS